MATIPDPLPSTPTAASLITAMRLGARVRVLHLATGNGYPIELNSEIIGTVRRDTIIQLVKVVSHKYIGVFLMEVGTWLEALGLVGCSCDMCINLHRGIRLFKRLISRFKQWGAPEDIALRVDIGPRESHRAREDLDSFTRRNTIHLRTFPSFQIIAVGIPQRVEDYYLSFRYNNT